MRVLYLLLLSVIQIPLYAMQGAACASQPVQAKVPVTFHDALMRVGKEAEAKRLAHVNEKEQADENQRVFVPDRLIKLGQLHASSIKEVFSVMLQEKYYKGISDLILDYISNSYMHYQDLFYWEHDTHGVMKAFYPCVQLTFDKNGTHIHAQLNANNTSSDHQLVGWSLYSNIVRSNQVQDYDLGLKQSKREHLNHVVCTRFMWWQAYTQNIFNNNGDFAPASTLKVVLQYSVAQMIKAALITD